MAGDDADSTRRLLAPIGTDIVVTVSESDEPFSPKGSASSDPAPVHGDQATALNPVQLDKAALPPRVGAATSSSAEPEPGVRPELQIREQLQRIEHQLGPLIGLAERAGRTAGGEISHEAARLGPAWRRATTGELRWPVSAVVAAMIAMQLSVPGRLSLPGQWLVPALEIVLLAVLVISNPVRITATSPVTRSLGLALIATASLANAYAAISLIIGIVHGTEGTNAGALLVTGGNIWLTNILVFGLWYWELDRGGPASRALALKSKPSFLFPEMTVPNLAATDWEPLFIDYLYVSFTNAAAFSPTDTMPFSRWSKMAMMLQSIISLATIALVIARAVNILK